MQYKEELDFEWLKSLSLTLLVVTITFLIGSSTLKKANLEMALTMEIAAIVTAIFFGLSFSFSHYTYFQLRKKLKSINEVKESNNKNP